MSNRDAVSDRAMMYALNRGQGQQGNNVPKFPSTTVIAIDGITLGQSVSNQHDFNAIDYRYIGSSAPIDSTEMRGQRHTNHYTMKYGAS